MCSVTIPKLSLSEMFKPSGDATIFCSSGDVMNCEFCALGWKKWKQRCGCYRGCRVNGQVNETLRCWELCGATFNFEILIIVDGVSVSDMDEVGVDKNVHVVNAVKWAF